MRKLLIILFSFPMFVFAQGNADSLKFETIKATVNFLATDGKISKDVQFKLTCRFPNYNCLEASIDDKKLNGVLSKVRIWDSKKKGNTTEDVVKLKEKILNDILKPDSKAYRKTLPGYAAYIAKMEALVSGLNVRNKITEPAKPIEQAKPIEPAKAIESTKPVESAAALEMPAVAEESELQTTVPLDPLEENKMEESQLPLIALVASLIAIAIGIYAAFFKKNVSEASPLPSSIPDRGTEELEQEISRLKREIKQLQESLLKELESSSHSLGNRITELENNKNTIELAVNNKITRPVSVSKPVETEDIPISAGTSKYAKFSDLDHGGFSQSILSDEQDGEQTYELLISGNEAVYSVAEDIRSQKYALQNYEYLIVGCDIKGQPQGNSKIYTVAKGTLTRTAEGNWAIGNKAVIEFR